MDTEKTALYEELNKEAGALMAGERHALANLANVSALLGQKLPKINWAGFYLMNERQLVLGPFWGKPACLRIEVGKGVCGTAVKKQAVQRVEDVHLFPGHIACDSASASEIVLPIWTGGHVIGVLDIDSPVKARFTEEDESGLLQICRLIEAACDWGHCAYDLV